MTRTIQQGFDQLQTNLNITDLQESTVSARQRAIRSTLERQIVVLDSFLMGSYRRSTLIAPLATADVDIFVVLEPKYFNPAGQDSLLEIIRQALKQTYQTSTIRPDGQAVTITFTDFKVDVVPGFHRQGGGYLIPNAELQGWVSTNPKVHIEIWAKENYQHNGKLVPLLKMFKGWNLSHSTPLRSFHLETMALQALRGVTISNFPSGVRYAFDKMRESVKRPTTDEAGYAANVGDYLSAPNKMRVATNSLETAYRTAYEAEQLEVRGNTRDAFNNWRAIFGNYFPAYG